MQANHKQPMKDKTTTVEVLVGLNTLLAVEVEVPEIEEGEPDYDEAQKQALEKARQTFLDWLRNPENEATFDISDIARIEE
jgi:hypothetical protein